MPPLGETLLAQYYALINIQDALITAGAADLLLPGRANFTARSVQQPSK
jgi:hypothetical protein